MKQETTPKEFQRTLKRAIRTGAVDKRRLAAEFQYSVRTVERWAAGTQRPMYRIVRGQVMDRLRRRLAASRTKRAAKKRRAA